MFEAKIKGNNLYIGNDNEVISKTFEIKLENNDLLNLLKELPEITETVLDDGYIIDDKESVPDSAEVSEIVIKAKTA